MSQQTEENQNVLEEILGWFRARGRDVTTGFARAYAWMYDLPYEEDITTSDIISAVEEGIEPYASTPAYRILASPASPIDALYHLAHPGGYDTTIKESHPMEDQDIEEVDFFRQVVQADINQAVGAPSAVPTTIPETIDPSYIEPIYEGLGMPAPTPVPLGTIPTYESTPMSGEAFPYSDEGSYNYDPPYDPGPGGDPGSTFGGGITSMTLAPFGQDTAPGMLGPMGRRTLIKTWLAGPRGGPRIRFYHFYMGNRKYVGCVKADGSWKQWPVYKPLVLGKTMTDRKAKRVARRMDSYMKSVRKIARVLGCTLKR